MDTLSMANEQQNFYDLKFLITTITTRLKLVQALTLKLEICFPDEVKMYIVWLPIEAFCRVIAEKPNIYL